MALALTAPGLTGCDPGGSEVRGTVTLEGSPVAGAEVVFHPEDGKGSPFGGRTGADGGFRLSPGADGKGPPPGSYRVVITRHATRNGEVPGEEDLEMLRLEGKVRNTLPPAYASPRQTPLTASVGPGDNDIPLPLRKRP